MGDFPRILMEISMKQIAYAVALILIFASAIQAQSPQPSPEQKKLLVCVGDWTYTEERRDSASEPWYKVVGSMRVRTILGGFFNEWRGKETVKGKEMEGVEIGGYNPAKKTIITSFFLSDGSLGQVTSGTFVGNRLDVKYTVTGADGKTSENRNAWTYAPDGTSVSGQGERLIDGRWVPIRKMSFTKIKSADK
jgi:hypothetical protein